METIFGFPAFVAGLGKDNKVLFETLNPKVNLMPSLLPEIDPDGLLEYSVVYTDRALNHMSMSFRMVMIDISKTLQTVYNSSSVVVVPGSGTFAMEAVARQFATDKKCLVIRNGWFSFRWSQIFQMGNIPESEIVLKATRATDDHQSPFAPPAIDEVVAVIKSEQPDVVFAPHVETSAGMMLPDEYLIKVAEAVHEYGGLFVLDCIASGTIWVDMKKCGVDVLISAPQKGWSGTPCAGLVMLSDHAVSMMEQTSSSSFACDLKKWHQIMGAYLTGGHAYHATMPTDGLVKFRDAMKEMYRIGMANLKLQQIDLGTRIRRLLSEHGFKSLAADGFQSPGVVVCYTDDPEIKSGKKFADAGIQIAAGVPLECNEPADFQSFRIGLFGVEKLQNVDRTIELFNKALSSFA